MDIILYKVQLLVEFIDMIITSKDLFGTFMIIIKIKIILKEEY